MRRILIAAAAIVAVGGFISSASAIGFDETAHHIKQGAKRNRIWPWPYVCADRVAVREPFSIMINNGWRRQNLLGPHHFNDKSEQLTSAGELRVQWIMSQAPEARRQIFIERDINPDVTAKRLVTARDYASRMAVNGAVPEITETHLASEGRPASVVDAMNVRFQESMPAPTLPAATLTIGTEN
jgi:hypothetical protein